jgi:hypothetical protein
VPNFFKGEKSMKKVTLVLVFVMAAMIGVQAQTHALTKVVSVAVTPVRHPKVFTKATLGTVVFATENVVDVVHAGLHAADVGLTAVSLQGKIPVLDEAQAVVAVADKDAAKLDSWLERQELYLFGKSN